MLKTYDALYVFEPVASEEALEPMMARLRSEIVRLDGEVISEEVSGRRQFARPMKKRDFGMYAHIRFRIDPVQIQALRKRYRLVEGLLRVQVLVADLKREEALVEQAARQEANAAAMAAANQNEA